MRLALLYRANLYIYIKDKKMLSRVVRAERWITKDVSVIESESVQISPLFSPPTCHA